MPGSTQKDTSIRFSVFELDPKSGELFKQGRKLKLQGQAFDLLLALVEHPGKVLTREELRQRLWPSDTVGDFDQGLNKAVNKVRDALGDSAESPRFIETLPRRGYRFIGPVERNGQVASPTVENADPKSSVDVPLAQATERAKERRFPFWVAAGGISAFLVASLAGWIMLHRSAPGQLQMQQLTTNSADDPIIHSVIFS
jgi:DNA-binding winged helix-turn-helix (wHTH) protein